MASVWRPAYAAVQVEERLHTSDALLPVSFATTVAQSSFAAFRLVVKGTVASASSRIDPKLRCPGPSDGSKQLLPTTLLAQELESEEKSP